MPAWLLPAGMAAASLVGGALQNRASRKESARNRQFQERMRNTQWQAAVADMEAAGINPALAYSQGPAASPGGSMASQSDVVTPAVSSAMQAKRLQADLEFVKEQTQKVREEGRGAAAAADLATARVAAYGIEPITVGGRRTFKMTTPGGGLPLLTREVLSAIERQEYTAKTLKPMADISERLGELLPALMLMTQLNPAGAAKRMLRKGR